MVLTVEPRQKILCFNPILPLSLHPLTLGMRPHLGEVTKTALALPISLCSQLGSLIMIKYRDLAGRV